MEAKIYNAAIVADKSVNKRAAFIEGAEWMQKQLQSQLEKERHKLIKEFRLYYLVRR